MATLENLQSHGWHITSEGFNNLSENGSIIDIRNITRKALDVDIRDFGAPIIASEINKSTFGPVILQVVKIRNISAPKSKQNSQTAPRMLKVILTDGHTNCQGIETKNISSISLDKTIPGTKIFINNAPVLSGSILLTAENCKILGGNVSALVEKWEISKLMPSHIRVTEDGPPAWVNFGKKIISNIANQNFKSLENKNKENTKENAEFQVQRQDAIAEATQGAVKKVFGGGVKPVQTFNESNHYNNYPKVPRQYKMAKNKDKSEIEKMDKPSQNVSLFDFLEDKLSFEKTNPASNKIVNDMSLPLKSKLDFSENTNQRNKPNKFKPSPSFNNSYPSRQDYEKPKLQLENRYQNDKPPRFQKQKNDGGKFSEPRPKPNTNIFVDKLANEINNISLYNTKYENEKLKQTNRVPENASGKPWKWKVGDRCMAKYWEDDKFYNAVVTGITNRTCMVEFVEYGNFEEVLHTDCIPITTEKQDRQFNNKFNNDNQDFSGNLEFRRGKNRPYTKSTTKPQGQSRNYDS